MEAKDELVRVRFETDAEGLGHGSPERLCARRIRGSPEGFELQNSPFYAKGVSYLDVVEAIPDNAVSGEFHYQKTLMPSGHSTYRILVDKGPTLLPSGGRNSPR